MPYSRGGIARERMVRAFPAHPLSYASYGIRQERADEKRRIGDDAATDFRQQHHAYCLPVLAGGRSPRDV